MTFMQFLLRTIHSFLCWVMSFKEPQDQMAYWIERLSQYHFQIEHREGKNMGMLMARPDPPGILMMASAMMDSLL